MNEHWRRQVDLGNIIFYALTTSAVVLLTLIVLQVTARRVHILRNEVDSLRREMKLVDEGLETVNAALAKMGEQAAKKLSDG